MTASSRGGSSSGRSPPISLATLSRVLMVLIFLAALQSFVLLSTVANNDVKSNNNNIFKALSSPSSNNTATSVTTQQKKHSLYCHLTQRQRNEKIKHFLCNGWNESDRLIQVDESHMHDPRVIWVTSEFKDIVPLVNTSIQLRLERHGKKITDNLSLHELDDIDPEWKIFIYDIQDNGIGNGWLWNVNNTISPMVGCKRINFLTRTAQKGRHMMKWVNQLKSGKNPSMRMSLAKPLNFTKIFEEEKLNPACASVQRLSFHVREDIKSAIDEYMERKHNYNLSIAKDSDLSYTIAHLPRPIDVRTFWNEEACNNRCSLRNFVSDTVTQIGLKHPEITVNTDVAGYVRGRGRRNVHRAYIRGMLGTKIIVLAQRDKWEDHLRLDEALLSGALVLHDPSTYWPHKMIDGINFVVYHNMTDLESKILYYLNPMNDEERMAIGQRGRELALNYHRLWHQAERILLNDMSYHNDYGLYNKPWMNGEYSPSVYQ